MPAFLERFIRSRSARLTLSIVLIALALWAFLPHLVTRVAPSAFVNAELLRITAPIAGQLSDEVPRTGSFINQIKTVKLIEVRSPDHRQLLDLERQYESASKKTELAGAQLAEIATVDAALAERLQIFREGMTARLREEINEATVEKKGCLAESKPRRVIGAIMEGLAKRGLASPIRSAEALALQEANTTKCEMAESRFQRLHVELISAQTGVYLRDGVNDVPYSQQQRDRLMLRRQEIESFILSENSRASQLQSQIAAERSRVESMNHYDLPLPADHVVWSVAASAGSAVTEGQTVLDLADCRRRFLVVELPERDFEKINTGDSAAIRLIGSDDWREGQIRQVRGSAARSDDRLLAAQVPRATLNNITIEIGFPEDDAATDRFGFCDIGRLAEVRFQRSGFGLFHQLTKMLDGLSGETVRKTTSRSDEGK
jgi:multidrug resistance efflux pump